MRKHFLTPDNSGRRIGTVTSSPMVDPDTGKVFIPNTTVTPVLPSDYPSPANASFSGGAGGVDLGSGAASGGAPTGGGGTGGVPTHELE